MSVGVKSPRDSRIPWTYEEVHRIIEDALRQGITNVEQSSHTSTTVDIMELDRNDPMWLQKYLAMFDVLLKILKEKSGKPLLIVLEPDYRLNRTIESKSIAAFYRDHHLYPYRIGLAASRSKDKLSLTITRVNDIPQDAFLDREQYVFVNTREGVLKYSSVYDLAVDVLKSAAYLLRCYDSITIYPLGNQYEETYLILGKLTDLAIDPIVTSRAGIVTRIACADNSIHDINPIEVLDIALAINK